MLRIEDLSYRVGDFTILDRIFGQAGPGQVVGVIGPNGAGKSTLANVLCGLLDATHGRVLLTGQVLSGQRPEEVARHGVRRMFQGQHLAWNLTALENIAAVLGVPADPTWFKSVISYRPEALRSSTALAKALDILAAVGLADRANARASELSFGEQRLLAFGKAIATPSQLLILDEPFSGLKSAAKERILQLVRAQRDGRLILAIDHDLAAVVTVATQFWFMHRGRLWEFPSYAALRETDLFRRHYLGIDPSSEGALSESPGSTSGAPDLPRNSNDSKAFGRQRVHHGGADSTYEANRALTVIGLSGGYGSHVVFHDVSFSIKRGEVLCILGLNASGKSTLLRVIAGVAKRFAGTIDLTGRSIHPLPPDARVRCGLRSLPQDHRIFRSLTVEDNLRLGVGQLSSRQPPASIVTHPNPSVAIPATDRTDLWKGIRNRQAGLLSGGEQARLALELLRQGPLEVVLLDEPTSGTDAIGVRQLKAQIAAWRASGKGIIVVEHDLAFVSAAATRVAILSDGMLREIATSAAVAPDILLNELNSWDAGTGGQKP